MSLPFVVVTATALEAKAARRELPRAEVVEAGVALARFKPNQRRAQANRALITFGFADPVRSDLPAGTVVIPRDVLRPDGSTIQCDPDLTQRLIDAARAIGIEPVTDPMVTTEKRLNGERHALSQRGYAAADMETGLLEGSRIASVRVVLDESAAVHKPWHWPKLVQIARERPRSVRRAAQVLAQAFGKK